MRLIRTGLLSGVVGLLMSISAVVFAESDPAIESGPFEKIEQVTAELLLVIADHAEGFPENEPQYFQALNTLLEQHIDFNYIAKSVMGRSAKSATGEQRIEFATKFRNGLIETYGRGLIGYGDEKIVLLNKAPLKPGQRMVSVKQEIQAEGAVYPMEYSMALSKKTGQWKAINVVINGINMRNIFRSQFANAVQRAGGDIDVVIADWSAE
ncbi:MAG: ABC transporter substrate-binding protein [Porticoccaceae bacterium]|jgi:phospholipid transport system substrate-binding protein|nr:ABC transporter substrate-binding protein [Porticoccaceae bacterium]